MAIPMYERQGRQAPLPGARVQNAAGPDAYGAGVGQAMKQFGGTLDAKVEEFEDAETLELLNDFQRKVNEYHSDPEKGLYATRTGKNAPGSAEDSDVFMDNLVFEYGGKLQSNRASANFERMAGAIRQRQYLKNMDWESAQTTAYKNAEADASVELALDNIAKNYADPDAVRMYRDTIFQALELKLRGAGDEARKLAVQGAEDAIGEKVVSNMMESDPTGARQWYQENKSSLSGGLRNKIEGTLQVYENQEIVSGLMEKFGYDERSALEYIREHYDGARQARLVTDYRQRQSELHVTESREAERVSMMQKENYRAFVTNFIGANKPVPLDQINRAVVNGDISFEHGEKLKADNIDMADVSKVKKEILADPLFRNASTDEFYTELQKRMNISPEESNAVFNNLHTAIVTGNATQADVALEESRGRISPADAERLSELEKKFLPEQKKYLDDQRKEFEKEIVNLGKNGLSNEGILAATDFFMGEASKLDPADPGYREKVFKTRQQALLSSFDAHTGSLRSNLKTLQSGYEVSKFNILDNAYPQEAFNMRSSAASNYPNEFAVNYFTQGGQRISSPFGATEAFRDKGHKGMDIAAPAGTPVTAPHAEGFTVTSVVTGKSKISKRGTPSENAGNMIKMQKNVGGKNIEITYMHLGDVAGVKSGDVLQPGQVVGGVGNTGFTVGKNGGYHLDVRVRVDGEFVDPKTLPVLLANAEDQGVRHASTFTQDMRK